MSRQMDAWTDRHTPTSDFACKVKPEAGWGKIMWAWKGDPEQLDT